MTLNYHPLRGIFQRRKKILTLEYDEKTPIGFVTRKNGKLIMDNIEGTLHYPANMSLDVKYRKSVR